MHYFIKWIGLLAFFLLAMNLSHAWTIGSKGRVTGPAIHTTYFLTPNNQAFDVHALAYVGYFVNNSCQITQVYDIGSEKLASGDFVDINAFLLRDLVGSGYSCMTIYYTYHQLVTETLELFWDGFNYYTTNPTMSEVTIL